MWAYLHYEPTVSLDRLLDLFEDYGYFVIFVPVMLETAGVPLPGETILLLSGVAASTGRIDPWIAIAVGSAAAIIGDNIGYAIGRYGGRRLVLRLAHIGRIEKSLAWGENFFARHGGKTVFSPAGSSGCASSAPGSPAWCTCRGACSSSGTPPGASRGPPR